MEKLRATFRLFVAFVLGALLGVIGTVIVINSGHEIGDSLIAGAPRVKALQRDLDEIRSHRDSVTLRFEKLVSQLEQVESGYQDLRRRFESIEAGLHPTGQPTPHAPAPRPEAAGVP